MEPAALKAIIEEAVRSATNGMMPVSWAAATVSALVGAIGVLWAWGLKLSKDYASKVLELSAAQREREDAIRAEAQPTIDRLLGQQRERYTGEIDTLKERCARLEASRDMARDQHSKMEVEHRKILGELVREMQEALEEAGDIGALAIEEIKKSAERRQR